MSQISGKLVTARSVPHPRYFLTMKQWRGTWLRRIEVTGGPQLIKRSKRVSFKLTRMQIMIKSLKLTLIKWNRLLVDRFRRVFPRSFIKCANQHSDKAIPLSKAKDVFISNNWPLSIDSCLIGSCTNSSYEDMTKASSIAQQASSRGIKAQSKFFVTPGSEQIRATTERDGQISSLSSVGGIVLANACGPCIGQWNRSEQNKESNVILSSFNRNFRSRNDGNLNTMNFLASPEVSPFNFDFH